MAKAAFKPTEEQRKVVERGAAVGITEDQLSDILGINKSTLRKYFLPELTTAGSKANMAVAAALYNSAMKGNVTAQIFWCKTRLHWREVNPIELTGKDGGPVQGVVNVTLAETGIDKH